MASDDFGGKFDAKVGGYSVHNHLFVSANTALTWWNKDAAAQQRHEELLKKCCRVDIFGVREEGAIDGKLHAPLRPELPMLEPGKPYLLETVIRTLKMGHPLTQGTVDSNELWLDVEVLSNGKVVGRSGGMSEDREVDPWSHFVNVFMLDRNGNRIDRRNAQDIFTPLYNHQIPPGAGQTVHYRLDVPEDLTGPLEVKVKLQYRKFDKRYMEFMGTKLTEKDREVRGLEIGKPYINPLPIVTMAEDSVILPVKGVAESVPEQKRDIEVWQRWNDYGIGMLLKGKAELKQANEAFVEVEKLGRADGPLNQARALFEEGDLNGATEALQRATSMDPPAPPWTVSWLSGVVDRQQGNLERAAESLRGVLETKVPSETLISAATMLCVMNWAWRWSIWLKRPRSWAKPKKANDV